MKRLPPDQYRKLHHAHAQPWKWRWKQFCRKMDRRRLRYAAERIITEGIDDIHKSMQLMYRDWDKVGVPYSVWIEPEEPLFEEPEPIEQVSSFDDSWLFDDDRDDLEDLRDDRGYDYNDDYDFNRNYDYGFPHEYY